MTLQGLVDYLAEDLENRKDRSWDQAEEALKAAREAVERERSVRVICEQAPEYMRDSSAKRVLAILNPIPKPVTNSGESAVRGEESEG